MIAPQTLLQNRYLVIKQIGQGGMGAVYLATDQRFGSTVALKETFFTDAVLRKAFEREAHLLNRLRHPALPNVSDHFLEDEGQFLVMEFIAGEDLSEMIKEQGGAFPVKEVLGWADQLLDALDYLHTQESPVIHRDIKPQNLKLTPRGQIILLDFGLAKGTPLQVSQATASGSVFGYSRNYAPIEQIQGTGTTPLSDLYSLAATLYHLITGVTPPDALTRATNVLNGQPDPLLPANEIQAQITPAVAQVLTRAMSQNAGQRPQSAAAMREALSEARKQTLVVGNVTTPQASVEDTIAEQDTQLMGTRPAGARTSVEPGAIGSDEAPPVDDATNADAAALKTTAGELSAKTKATDKKSETTHVQKAPSVKRSLSGRAVGIAAGGFILIFIAAIVFAMTRRPATPPVTTSTPAETSSPSPTNSPTVQSNPTQNTSSENALPVEPQSSPSQKSEPAAKTSKGTGTQATSKELPTVPSTPVPPERNPRANSNNANDTRPPNNATWTKREIAEARRRARAEKQRAMAERQRAERERRRAEALRRQQTSTAP